MPYSEKEFDEIERNPVRRRAYFWHVAMSAQRTARRNRALSRRLAVAHPVTNYKPVFEEGHDLLAEAAHMDRFAKSILDNIDLLVETTGSNPVAHGQGLD